MSSRQKVLILDQGLAFGGALVVGAQIAGGLDRERFDVYVAAAMDGNIVRHHFGEKIPYSPLKQRYTYALHERLNRQFIEALPGFARKLGVLMLLGLRLIMNLPFSLRLASLLRAEKPALVHFNNGTGYDEAEFVCKLMGVPRVVHLHGMGAIDSVQRYLSKSVGAYIAISQHVADAMIGFGIPANKVRIVFNAASQPQDVSVAQRVEIRARYGLDDNHKIFGIFGRILPWKGQLEFLQAAVKVLAEDPAAVALLVGDSSDGDQAYVTGLHALAEESGFSDRIIFTGYVQPTAELYAIMDLVLHCSIEPEPFGLVITEAMSYGVPVIVSPLGAPPEIISDGVEGKIVDPNDSQALAAAVLALLADSDRRNEMGEKARATALNKFSMQRFITGIEQTYSDVIAAKDQAEK